MNIGTLKYPFLVIATLFFLLYGCEVVNDTTPRPGTGPKPADNSQFGDGKNELSTIPGNNVFLTDEGTIRMTSKYPLIYPSVNFKSFWGRCDVATFSGIKNVSVVGYTITMHSKDSGGAALVIYFTQFPTSSGYRTLVPFNKAAINDTSSWAVLTRYKDGKTWNVVSGKLNFTNNSGLLNATMDTVKIQNYGNSTDTTYYKMSSYSVCK